MNCLLKNFPYQSYSLLFFLVTGLSDFKFIHLSSAILQVLRNCVADVYRVIVICQRKWKMQKDPNSKHPGNPGHNEKTKPIDNRSR